MSQAPDVVTEMLGLSELQKPQDNVTLLVRANVETRVDRLRARQQIERVTVGRYGGRYYPIGNLEALEAHKICASESLPCEVVAVKDANELLEMHLVYSQPKTLDPVAVMDAVARVRESSPRARIPKEYAMFNVDLLPSTRTRLSEFVHNEAEKETKVPDLSYILLPLSKLDSPYQSKALDRILEYVMSGKPHITPDIMTVKGITAQFGRPDTERAKHVTEEPPEPGTGKKSKQSVDVKVRQNRSSAASLAPPVADSIHHTCKCRRKYVINLKNATMRELKKSDSHVTMLSGDHGEPLYAFPDMASYLELASKPKLYYTGIGGGKRGHTYIVSKRDIPKRRMAQIRAILDAKK